MGSGSKGEAPQGAGGERGHTPVLLSEAIEFLAVRRGGSYIDATVGAGGHSLAIARRLGAEGRLTGFDKDPAALALACTRLAPPGADWPQIELRQGSFTGVAELEPGSADGLLADLGLSSLQVDDAGRGFSFQG